jgi:hypothetical protein
MLDYSLPGFEMRSDHLPSEHIKIDQAGSQLLEDAGNGALS